MPEKVVPFPKSSKPARQTAEWHSRVTFQIGADRYTFEFFGSITGVHPLDAQVISIDQCKQRELPSRLERADHVGEGEPNL